MKRKAISIILVLALCVGMAVPALAAKPNIIQSITINIPGASGLTATFTNVYADYFAPASVPRSERYVDILNGYYLFLFKDSGTVSFNQDVMLIYNSALGFDLANAVDFPTLKAGEMYNMEFGFSISIIDGKVVSRLSEAIETAWGEERENDTVTDLYFMIYNEWAESSDDYNFDKREETWKTPRLPLSGISGNASSAVTATPRVGEPLGDVLYSDITAYINGSAIPTSVINGKTLVTVEDLAKYGFDVKWDGAAKTLKVELDKDKAFNPMATTKDTSNKPGTFKEKYVYTDIKTYISGEEVECYAIKGVTLIDFDALGKFGKFAWDGKTREIRLTID